MGPHKLAYNATYPLYTLSTPGLVPEQASQVEEATKVQLLVALTISPNAFPLTPSPWRHHLILTLLGAQRLLRFLHFIPLLLCDYWRSVAIFWDW